MRVWRTGLPPRPGQPVRRRLAAARDAVAGTVVGRAATDRLVRRFGAGAVVRTAALSVAGALAGMAAAPSWPFAVLAAGVVGLRASVLAPLCLAYAAPAALAVLVLAAARHVTQPPSTAAQEPAAPSVVQPKS